MLSISIMISFIYHLMPWCISSNITLTTLWQWFEHFCITVKNWIIKLNFGPYGQSIPLKNLVLKFEYFTIKLCLTWPYYYCMLARGWSFRCNMTSTRVFSTLYYMWGIPTPWLWPCMCIKRHANYGLPVWNPFHV